MVAYEENKWSVQCKMSEKPKYKLRTKKIDAVTNIILMRQKTQYVKQVKIMTRNNGRSLCTPDK